MDEGDRHAAFADAGGDPLDRAVANVTRREDAGHARLEQEWIARARPATLLRRDEIEDVAAGADVAAVVADDGFRQPGRLGIRADEYEQRIRLATLLFAGLAVLDDDRLEMISTFELDHLPAQQDLDVRLRVELFDQVV